MEMIMKKNIVNMHPAMVVNQTKVAQLTGKSINTIRDWEKQGLLHPTIIGGSKLYDLDELVPLIKPKNPNARTSYVIADVPDYNKFIEQVATDVQNKLTEQNTANN